MAAEDAVTQETPGQAAERAVDGRTGPAGTDHTRGAAGHGSGPGKPKDKTPIIIAVVGIIGVVIAWVSYTHSQNAQTAANATNPALGTGTVAGGTDVNALANMMTNMQDELTQLTDVIGQSPAPSGPTSTSNSTAPTPVTKVATPPAHKAVTTPVKPKTVKVKPPAPKAPAATPWYTVRPGDTLSGIAARLKIPGGWQALYSRNRGVVGGNPNLIHPGERLQLPPGIHGTGVALGGH